MDSKVYELLNDQINKELYSAYLYLTSLINDIYAAAKEVNDFRTMKFLDWFIDEQLEEEVNATDMVTKMKLFGSDAKSLYELDQEYLARTYSTPSPLAAE